MTIDQRTDKEKGLHHHEAEAVSGKTATNFDQKIYMFPESYNVLRAELYNNWPELWKLAGWAMAHDSPRFIEVMNAGLDLEVVLDSSRVDSICTEYLQALWKKRNFRSQ